MLYVDYSLGFGGAIKSLALTLRGMPEVEKFIFTSQDPELVDYWFPGLPVTFFRRRVNYRTTGRIAARTKNLWLRASALKMLAAADLFVSAMSTVRLTWLMARHGIDILHLNNGFTPPEALLSARILGVPCVVHLRDFQRDPGRLAFIGAREVAHVIVISDAVGESLNGTSFPLSARTTIHDPVDLDRIASAASSRARVREKCQLTDGHIAVGMFGRVIQWKGQREFVRAMVPVMRANPLVRAIIVGDESDASDAYIRDVRAQVESSGFAERFRLVGYQEEVEDYYAAMDIVVHASITPEPFGMVVPEAMAAGCPVIAADAGGPREVVESGKDGLLVPQGDVDALSGAVLRLSSNSALRSRMGQAARRKTSARFTIDAAAAQIAAVYNAVLMRNAPESAPRSLPSVSAPSLR